MKNVLEVLRATTEHFTRHGIENPRLNAEHLIAHVLGKKRLDLYLEFDRPLGEFELGPMRELVRRRAQGEPLQHLLGTVEFHGRVFRCDARALVPRPETEELVGQVLAEWKHRPGAARILDVGTGSGVIALTLAGELPEATVHASDISPEALALARENAAQLGLTGRITFIESDLFSAVAGPYDLVVANLPYIAAGEISALSPEVRRDPVAALDGGIAGHELIERFIAGAPRVLAPGGLLALEMGGDQAEPLTAALRRADFQQIRCIADLSGVNRFLFATYG
jgi:release factor glutamine methyltransferase